MEKETIFLNHKRISNKLPLMGLAFVILVAVGFMLKKTPKYKYKLSTEATLEKIIERNGVMRPELFMEVYNTNDSLYRFIDLRSAHEFLQGHLPNAINIPLHKLLDKEYKAIFNQDEKINVLYYSDQCGACGPWIILTELGYKNNILLQGGYNYVKTNIIDEYKPMSGNFRAEKARYDFAKIVNETSGAAMAKPAAKTVAPPPAASSKKKVVEEEGGC